MIVNEIKKLRSEKKAVILAHYYQEAAIQDVADYVGDSLALARWAAATDADVIVLCGVHFMAETAKILCPNKRVFLPDMAAGCSLADSCPPKEFADFVKKHPDHTVISYVNTSAAIKCLTDIVVTSSNARQIVDSFPADAQLIFAPDRNLGNYINSVTGRNMVLWEGACHVHERFSLEKMLALKKEHPDALILAHPECKGVILKVADCIASTSGLLDFATKSTNEEFIVATESGILHEMQEKNPQKTFIPAPPNDSTCACNECNFMKLNTLEKLRDCLKNESPEIVLDAKTMAAAAKPIRRMLELSAKLRL
ncbi:quinolinate synthetase [Candidatus Symbiothrix dinenymphae]|nr:quinolinate synthetase [Candidatus Symbiothrix dinenymphae]